MDESFILAIDFLTTIDAKSKMSSKDVVEKLGSHFEYLTPAAAKLAMDIICPKQGREGSPKVSRAGGNIRAPVKDYPLRWKTPMEIVRSAKVLVVVAMGIEFRVVERALRKPFTNVSEIFPSPIANAIVGLVERCPVLVIRTRDYGSIESYAATSHALFVAHGVEEVLKVGTAVYKEASTNEKNRFSWWLMHHGWATRKINSHHCQRWIWKDEEVNHKRESVEGARSFFEKFCALNL